MKKIAFLSHLDLNLYLFRLPIMIEMVKRGYEVYALCPKGEVFDKFQEHNIKAISYDVDRSSLNIFKEFKTIQNIKKVINPLKLDILHTFMHKPNIYSALANTNARVVINTVTGLGSFFIHTDIKSKIVKFIILSLYKNSFKKINGVIFQNSDDLSYFVNQKILNQDKAFLVRSSGIDTDKFVCVKTNLKEELEIEKDKIVVLMIARVLKDKGVLEYIEMAKILKEKAEFLYVGGMDEGNKNSFLPDFENIKYLGFRSDVKELISISDIMVLPSYREGTPRTLLEAASMSKPIVTTNAVGCKEVVDEGINGFLVPIKDSKELAKKVEILIEDENLREEFGKNSRKKAVNEFDIKIVVNKYIEIYDKLSFSCGLNYQ
jgi:N,N'-diacetylbacillosaminyl-diphospho-undecaprenol alpha-1,3-N-acetylgalactosaminyltransferase